MRPFLPTPLLVLLLLGSLVACEPVGDDDDSAIDDDDASDDDDSAPDSPPYLNVLETPADLALLADGGGVKFIAPVAAWEREPPITEDCYFQDMERYPWHLQFLLSFEELAGLDMPTYEAWVVQPETRRWWGGAVQLWPGVDHPLTGQTGVLSFVVYSDYQDPQLTVEQVTEVHDTMRACVPFAADLVVWVPDGGGQRAFATDAADALAEAGVGVVLPEDLFTGVESEVWSPGEGYGTLRLVPEGQDLDDYGPRDVVVVTQAPNEMSLVSGLITAAPQNLHSHINLRLREKGIPSVTIASIYDNALVQSLDGSLVHLVAPEQGSVTLEPADLPDAEAFWATRYPELPPVEADLDVGALATFASLGHEDAIAYGAKAAGLAELHGLLPRDNRPDGFAIPFSAYADHVARAGIDALIDEILDDERLHSDRDWKEDALDDIRDAIRDAELDPALLAELEEVARKVWGDDAGTTRLRFRSSSNVEDLDELTGAGLYDSRSGCLGDDLDDDEQGPSACLGPAEEAWIHDRIAYWEERLEQEPDAAWIGEEILDLQRDLVEEKTVADALRRTWRSLWNVRAFDERAFYGIDHRDAYMGVAINPSFVMEQAEAVLVSNLDGGDAGPRYRAVSQAGDLGVVRPIDPGAVAEIMTFERMGGSPVNVDLLVESSEADGPLWTRPRLNVLAVSAFAVQDHFAAEVYPHIDPLRLDMEVEVTADDRVVIKQVRPYVTWEPAQE